MTEADRERLLDILWRAMSAAAGYEDIPADAQLIADEALPILDRLVDEPEPDIH
jgi:hypothetical protein